MKRVFIAVLIAFLLVPLAAAVSFNSAKWVDGDTLKFYQSGESWPSLPQDDFYLETGEEEAVSYYHKDNRNLWSLFVKEAGVFGQWGWYDSCVVRGSCDRGICTDTITCDEPKCGVCEGTDTFVDSDNCQHWNIPTQTLTTKCCCYKENKLCGEDLAGWSGCLPSGATSSSWRDCSVYTTTYTDCGGLECGQVLEDLGFTHETGTECQSSVNEYRYDQYYKAQFTEGDLDSLFEHTSCWIEGEKARVSGEDFNKSYKVYGTPVLDGSLKCLIDYDKWKLNVVDDENRVADQIGPEAAVWFDFNQEIVHECEVGDYPRCLGSNLVTCFEDSTGSKRIVEQKCQCGCNGYTSSCIPEQETETKCVDLFTVGEKDVCGAWTYDSCEYGCEGTNCVYGVNNPFVQRSFDSVRSLFLGYKEGTDKANDEIKEKEGERMDLGCAADMLPITNSKLKTAVSLVKATLENIELDNNLINYAEIKEGGLWNGFNEEFNPLSRVIVSNLKELDDQLPNSIPSNVLNIEFIDDSGNYFNYLENLGNSYPNEIQKIINLHNELSLFKDIVFLSVGGLITVVSGGTGAPVLIVSAVEFGTDITECYIDFSSEEYYIGSLIITNSINGEEVIKHFNNVDDSVEYFNDKWQEQDFDLPVIDLTGSTEKVSVKNEFKRPVEVEVEFNDKNFGVRPFCDGELKDEIWETKKFFYPTDKISISSDETYVFDFVYPASVVEWRKNLKRDYCDGMKKTVDMCSPSKLVVDGEILARVFYGEEGAVAMKEITVPLNGIEIGCSPTSNPVVKVENDIKKVEYVDDQGEKIVEFDYEELDLVNVTIESNEGSLLVKGLDLGNQTKTVYVEKVGSGSKVCLLDAEIDSIDEMTNDCSGENEVLLDCPAEGEYSCEIVDGKFKISGLKHSGVKEIQYCGDGNCNNGESCSSCSSDCGSCNAGGSGGGSGGGSSGGSKKKVVVQEPVEPVCTPKWECSSWKGVCENGFRTRTCEDGCSNKKTEKLECKMPEVEKTVEVEPVGVGKAINVNKKTKIHWYGLAAVLGVIGILALIAWRKF